MKSVQNGKYIHIAAIASMNDMFDLYNAMMIKLPKMELIINIHIKYINDGCQENTDNGIRDNGLNMKRLLDSIRKVQLYLGKTHYEYLDAQIGKMINS